MPLPPWYWSDDEPLYHPYLDAGYALLALAHSLGRTAGQTDRSFFDSHSKLTRALFDVSDPLWIIVARSCCLEPENRTALWGVASPIDKAVHSIFCIWREGPDAIGAGERACDHFRRMESHRDAAHGLGLDLLGASAEFGEEVDEWLRFDVTTGIERIAGHVNRLCRNEDQRRREASRASRAASDDLPAAAPSAAPRFLPFGQPEPVTEEPKKGKKPSNERAKQIISAIRRAGRPLLAKEIMKELGLGKSRGSLPHNLSYMASEGHLINTPGCGYWPAEDPTPGSGRAA
jgi:hypothetical protein